MYNDLRCNATKSETAWNRTSAFQLIMSVELQNDLLRPYISHGLTGEQLATYIHRDFVRILEVAVTEDCVSLRRNYVTRSRASPVTT
jgi:hypothetical protein